MKKRNSVKKIILKAAVSIILIAFLLFKINPKEILSVLKQINPFLFLLSAPVFVFIYIIRTKKWNFLLEELAIKIRFVELLKIFLIGIFYGMLTPGKAGELVRAYHIQEKKTRVIPTIIIDKLIDIFSLFLLSLLAVVIFFNNKILVLITLFIGFSLIAVLFALINKKTISIIFKLFRVDSSHQEEYLENIGSLFKNKRPIIKNFAYSMFFYGLSFIAAYFILKSMSYNINMLVVFTLPLIILLGNAPITIAGLGLREFITVLAFERFNEAASLGFSFSLIWFFMMTVIPGLIGYAFMLKK